MVRVKTIWVKVFLRRELSHRNNHIVTEFITLLYLHNIFDIMQSLNGIVFLIQFVVWRI